MKIQVYFIWIFWMVFNLGCSNTDATEEKILKIPIDFDIIRYDKAFTNANSEDLDSLKRTFPYMFAEQYTDSLWKAKLDDALLDSLGMATLQTFKDFEPYQHQIKELYQHIKYYFPAFKEPDILTVISEVDYENKVIYADTIIAIGLDNYLGKNHKYYEGIYEYIRQEMNAENLIVDIANAIIDNIVSTPYNNTFVSWMVYEGKKIYLKDLLIPKIAEHLKISYTPDQLLWAKENEKFIWKYFIQKKILYDTTGKVIRRFNMPAPYSKFYLTLDRETPPRLGQFIGWQIVKNYLSIYDETTLKELLNLNNEILFSKSKYKPNNN